MIRDGRPWEQLDGGGPGSVEIDGISVRAGSRVRLEPRRTGSDIFEAVLAGRTGIVQEVRADHEGRVQLAIVVDDAVPRNARALLAGQRFFFDPLEVRPATL
jgi:hypothetical protein